MEAVHSELSEARAIKGTEPIFGCSKAERVLGWQPTQLWHDAEDASVDGTGSRDRHKSAAASRPASSS